MLSNTHRSELKYMLFSSCSFFFSLPSDDLRRFRNAGLGHIQPSRNGDSFQTAAAREGTTPNTGNAVRNHDARQTSAVAEGPLLDAGNAIRNHNTGQTTATIESVTPDAGDAVWHHDAR